MDAVILYVDGSDPVWQKEYYDTLKMPISPERFRDWGTLPYLFRGIDKYLPWIEKVFLVVSSESQVPVWIDRGRVRIVLHSDIIPKEYLPTFNSCVIETHIPYIKDLGEEFIYFNDDMFPVNPCEPELFFKDGKARDCLRERTIMEGPQNIYRHQCLNSANMARAALGEWESGAYYFPLHWPHPLKKSLCLEVLQKQKERFRSQISKIRTDRNVNQYVFMDYMYLKGETENVSLPYTYTTPKKKSPEEIADLITNSENKAICLNDSGCDENLYDVYEEAILGAFQAKFPEKCKYERGWHEKGDTIVAMASYPARIKGAITVWKSVLRQRTDVPVRCVMVLVEKEWEGRKIPAALKELVDQDMIELLWYPKAIRSHAKLLPVIKKYPDADIITIDDDMTKPAGWLQNMIDDHRRWPEEVISDSFTYFLNSRGEWGRMLDMKQKVSRGKNDKAGLVFNFARICSGHGTYFPAHTFRDERFFDEDEAMRIAPTCDETWMWGWATMEGRRFRQCSKIYDESAETIPGTQQMPTALYKANRNLYDKMYDDFFKAFPAFREELLRRQREYVFATEETLKQVRKDNPYCAVIVGDEACAEELLKRYQDRPNRVAEYEGARLYPPGWA